MRIENDIKLDFDDVLIRPKRSTLKSRKDVSLVRAYTFKNSNKDFWTGVPIMAANLDTTGTFEIATEFIKNAMPTAIHKFYSHEEWKHFIEKTDRSDVINYVIPSIGANESDLENFIKLYSLFPEFRFVCIDVANGYGEYFTDFVKRFKERFADIDIIAGNVVTGEMTEELLLSGASVVKVGIGPGSFCTTRLITGVGYPQLSATVECADAAHGLGGHIIADGGCRTPGDIAKAFCAGADFVMLGGMLAGHEESGGDLITEYESIGHVWSEGFVSERFGEKQYKIAYGMSSDTAQKKHYGEKKEYRSSEGRTVKVPYRGKIENTIQQILGGLRSACTYVGAPTLKQISKCTTFIRVNNTHNRVYTDKEI